MMRDNRHRLYKHPRREKPVFWQADAEVSKWLKIVRSAAGDVKLPELWKLKHLRD
jgi:hypothetical protein